MRRIAAERGMTLTGGLGVVVQTFADSNYICTCYTAGPAFELLCTQSSPAMPFPTAGSILHISYMHGQGSGTDDALLSVEFCCFRLGALKLRPLLHAF